MNNFLLTITLPPKRLQIDLNEPISQYLDALMAHEGNPENTSYSEVELFKLYIADVILQTLDVPIRPRIKEPDSDQIKTDPKNKNGKGFVYLAKNSRNGLYKIGYSKNPEQRENTLQSEEPEISMEAIYDGTRKIEEELHQKFSAKRVRGEWFKLDEGDVLSIKASFAEVSQ